MKGKRSHDIVDKALQVLINLEHRGACGCEANTGDGAGILLADARRVPARASCRSRCPTPARTAPASCSCRTTTRDREAVKALIGRITEEEGQRLLGWRDVPTDDSLVGPSARAAEPLFEQVFIGAGGGIAGADAALRFERKLYVIRKRVERAVETLKINALARRTFYIVSLSAQHADLQGHAHGAAAPADVSRICRPAARVGAGARAPAVQHQHVPVVAAGAPLPADRAQRRDQHAARQHQLDARARGAAQERGARRRPQEGAAGHPGRRQRHRHLRQRARAAGDGGPVAAARHADDDPRAVERQRRDGRRSEGVLRVPLVADGAVGRPGVDRVHRRHGDRRGARPQRAAAVALLRHQGRPGGHGLRSGRARHSRPTTCWRRGACSPGTIFLVDTAKGRIVDDDEIKRELAAEHPYREWIDAHLVRHRDAAGGAAPSSPSRRRCSPGSSRSATRRRTCGS